MARAMVNRFVSQEETETGMTVSILGAPVEAVEIKE